MRLGARCPRIALKIAATSPCATRATVKDGKSCCLHGLVPIFDLPQIPLSRYCWDNHLRATSVTLGPMIPSLSQKSVAEPARTPATVATVLLLQLLG